MKAVRYRRHGDPLDVLEVVDAPARRPASREVRCAVIAAPINPADLSTVRGQYTSQPPLPAVGGFEGVGRIVEVGADVRDLRPGQTVIVMGGTWQSEIVAVPERIIGVPESADPIRFATMIVNPTTALLLVEAHVALRPGDWIVQNAANSAVGGHVACIAKQRGVRTLNIVRRPGLEAELLELGADAVLVDGPDLRDRVLACTGGVEPRLALDSVAGSASARLCETVGERGVLVRYGAISGQPCGIDPAARESRRIDLRDFCLSTWRRGAPADLRRRVVDRVIALTLDGTLRTPIAGIYPIERSLEAIASAVRSGRSGKVLIAPNPELATHCFVRAAGAVQRFVADARAGLAVDHLDQRALLEHP